MNRVKLIAVCVLAIVLPPVLFVGIEAGVERTRLEAIRPPSEVVATIGDRECLTCRRALEILREVLLQFSHSDLHVDTIELECIHIVFRAAHYDQIRWSADRKDTDLITGTQDLCWS